MAIEAQISGTNTVGNNQDDNVTHEKVAEMRSNGELGWKYISPEADVAMYKWAQILVKDLLCLTEPQTMRQGLPRSWPLTEM